MVRAGSANTSMPAGPISNDHGWVLCGLAARTAAATAPSGPGTERQSRHGANAGPPPGSSTALS
ncbi:hypothetical protein ACFQV8_39885 [Pseudonocardia benzenivorans]